MRRFEVINKALKEINVKSRIGNIVLDCFHLHLVFDLT